MRDVDGVPFPYVGQSAARFSLDGLYRYELIRRWARGPVATWIMLNPSTADGVADDNTIRRCIGFTKKWNLGGIIVVNIFALRSTDPRALRSAADPIGPNNDESIHDAAVSARIVIAAWGTHGVLQDRGRRVLEDLAEVLPERLFCLGRARCGNPLHPLRLRGDLIPTRLEVT